VDPVTAIHSEINGAESIIFNHSRTHQPSTMVPQLARRRPLTGASTPHQRDSSFNGSIAIGRGNNYGHHEEVLTWNRREVSMICGRKQIYGGGKVRQDIPAAPRHDSPNRAYKQLHQVPATLHNLVSMP
jgi:hypothetical protein